MITEGMRVRNGIVEKVSKDSRLIALHCPESLGDKGRIIAENIMPDSKYANHGFPVISIGGKRYHVIEYCADYAKLMSRFFWYTHSYASAYKED